MVLAALVLAPVKSPGRSKPGQESVRLPFLKSLIADSKFDSAQK